MGTKPTILDHNSQKDVIGVTDFRFTFDRIPGNPGINVQQFAINCMQSAIPGQSIGKIEQNFPGGHTLSYPGKKTYTRSTAGQFIERVDFSTSTAITNWMEAIRGTRSGNAIGYKVPDLVAVGLLEVFDAPGLVANSYRLINCWPSELAEVQLDGSSEGQSMLWQVTFSYDWPENARAPIR